MYPPRVPGGHQQRVEGDVMEEEWRNIAGYPYDVSSCGRVRRMAPSRNTWIGRVLKPTTDRNGYYYVILCHEGIVRTHKIHILVCTAWHGEKPAIETSQVRHLNGMHQDNRPENLFWGTAQENADDREAHGRQAKGEGHPSALFTQKQVDALRQEYREHMRQRLQQGFVRAQRSMHSVWAQKYHMKIETLKTILSGRSYE